MWRGTGWKRGFCVEEDFVGKKKDNVRGKNLE
jgi:hypothetical protein